MMNDEAMRNYANTFCEDVTKCDDCTDCNRCLRLENYTNSRGSFIELYCEKNLMAMCAEKRKEEKCKKLYEALDRFADLYGDDSLKKEFETYMDTKDYI